MTTPLSFYVIDEHTDVEKYCKRRKLLPCKVEDRICYCSDPVVGDQIIKTVTRYSYRDYLYDVLDYSQCFSGYKITLMRLPKPSYDELLKMALTSKRKAERAGAIGIILKEHPSQFEKYLLSIKKKDLANTEVKRVVSFINDFVRQKTSYVWSLEKILSLCDELQFQMKQ